MVSPTRHQFPRLSDRGVDSHYQLEDHLAESLPPPTGNLVTINLGRSAAYAPWSTPCIWFYSGTVPALRVSSSGHREQSVPHHRSCLGYRIR